MNIKDQNALTVFDFRKTEHGTVFVKFTGYDHDLEIEFEGEVKFVGGRPYGDILHPQRSTLSFECREFVRTRLLDKYQAGEFEE